MQLRYWTILDDTGRYWTILDDTYQPRPASFSLWGAVSQPCQSALSALSEQAGAGWRTREGTGPHVGMAPSGRNFSRGRDSLAFPPQGIESELDPSPLP